LPPRTGLTLAEFVGEWRTNVAVNLKGSTTRAAESHLRAHITPKLGNLHLPEIHDVRIGKHISLEVEASSKEIATQKVDEACRKLLANPIMESYEFEIKEN